MIGGSVSESPTGDLAFWRIGTDASTYEAHDLRGLGAERSGGRWNRVGTPMVYASGCCALACVETIVHVESKHPLPLNRYLVEISVPADLWAGRTVADAAHLVGWDALPAGKVSLDWGTSWATKVTTAVAQVPSVIVPEESNILINPKHPDAARIGGRKVRKWIYDARLLRRAMTP